MGSRHPTFVGETVNGLHVRAADAGRQFVPAALARRFWTPVNFTVRR